MPIIEKAPNWYKQGTEVATSQAKVTSPLLTYRVTRKAEILAILIEDTQILAKFVTVRDLDLLLHHLIERFLTELAKCLLACI